MIMTKKKNKQNLQGKESFIRMNFLYQASMLMAGRNNTLSSYYGSLCRSIAKKSTLKIEPSVKRNLCKRCSLAQKPGVTSNLEIQSSKECKTTTSSTDENARVFVACQLCGYKRSFQVNTEYKFWLENPQSIAEVCTIQSQELSNDNNDKFNSNSNRNSTNCNLKS